MSEIDVVKILEDEYESLCLSVLEAWTYNGLSFEQDDWDQSMKEVRAAVDASWTISGDISDWKNAALKRLGD